MPPKRLAPRWFRTAAVDIRCSGEPSHRIYARWRPPLGRCGPSQIVGAADSRSRSFGVPMRKPLLRSTCQRRG